MNTIYKPENIEENIYKIKIKDIDKIDQNSLQEELKSRRIQELLKTGSLRCELFSKRSYENMRLLRDIIRFQTVDLVNTCATILEIKDDCIIVKASPSFKQLMMITFIDADISIYAYIRAISKCSKDKIEIFKLVTFDIIYDQPIQQPSKLPPIPPSKFKFSDDYDSTKIYCKNIICKEENNNE